MMKSVMLSAVCLAIIFVSIGVSSTRVTRLKSNSVEDVEKELDDIYRSIPTIESRRVTIASGTTFTDTISVKYQSSEDFVVIVTQASGDANPDLYVTNTSGSTYVITREITTSEQYNVLIIPVGVWGR